MLSFEVKPSQDCAELEIYCDAEGLGSLLAQLRFLERNKTDHVHLMAESWGGTHLDDVPLQGNNRPVRHVKITLVERSEGALEK